jgi:hypothetical protein
MDLIEYTRKKRFHGSLPTYTVSGKWNVWREDFMKNANTITNLSLRGSYGLTATAGPITNSLAIYKVLSLIV